MRCVNFAEILTRLDNSKPLFNQGNPFRILKVYLLSIGALIKLIYKYDKS